MRVCLIILGSLALSGPASALTVNRNWVSIAGFPSACPGGQFVSAVGTTLTCALPAGGAVTTSTEVWLQDGTSLTIFPSTSTSNVLIPSTLTVRGAGFSVGGSTFSCSNGQCTVGSTLNVRGMSYFGGITISTKSITWPDGTVQVSSPPASSGGGGSSVVLGFGSATITANQTGIGTTYTTFIGSTMTLKVGTANDMATICWAVSYDENAVGGGFGVMDLLVDGVAQGSGSSGGVAVLADGVASAGVGTGGCFPTGALSAGTHTIHAKVKDASASTTDLKCAVTECSFIVFEVGTTAAATQAAGWTRDTSGVIYPTTSGDNVTLSGTSTMTIMGPQFSVGGSTLQIVNGVLNFNANGTNISGMNYPSSNVNIGVSTNGPSQVVEQNFSQGTNASMSHVWTSSLGGNTSYYFNIGINGSNFNPNNGFSMEAASESFITSSDNAINILANLNGGTQAVNGQIRFAVNGANSFNQVMGISSGSVTIYDGSTLTVRGPSFSVGTTNFVVVSGTISINGGSQSLSGSTLTYAGTLSISTVGASIPGFSMNVNGQPQESLGLSTMTARLASGYLCYFSSMTVGVSSSTNGNGTAEVSFATCTIPANTLSAVGDCLWFSATVNEAATTNAKSLKIRYSNTPGTAGTIVLSGQGSASNQTGMNVNGQVCKSATRVQNTWGSAFSGSTNVGANNGAQAGMAGVNEALTSFLSYTLQSNTAQGDMQFGMFSVRYIPGPIGGASP